MCSGRTLILTCVLLAPTALGQGSFWNWENPPVHPLDITPDGTKLLATNLADNRLEIFSLASGAPVWVASVPVGLDPVSVRARTNNEAWVVNVVSDSVSVVDLNALNVIATLKPGDEPQDVVFAGSAVSGQKKAFVSVSQLNLLRVYDSGNLAAAPATVAIQGEDPRALATDGVRVFAAIFESGNSSTILPASIVSNPAGPYAGLNPPPNNNTAFNPPINPALPPPPPVALIVHKEPPGWLDDNGRVWDAMFSWRLHFHDVAAIDAATLNVIGYAFTQMNLNSAVAVRGATGGVTVVGTYDRNEDRFETIARASESREFFTTFNAANPTSNQAAGDLNPSLFPYQVQSIPQSQRNLTLADARGVIWDAAGANCWISGMSSNNVIRLVPNGSALNRTATINVGQGSTGLALDAPHNKLYCLNRFDANISVIDVASNVELSRVSFYDPTPAVIKQGRPLLYDAHAFSGLGLVACSGCHVDAKMDNQCWDVGNPAGAMKLLDQPCNAGLPLNGACGDWHPMKGPMVTQTLVGTVSEGPLHWRGDREDTHAFNLTYTNLMGADAPPSDAQMAALQAFIATIHFPPQPNRNIDNTLPASVPGFSGNPQSGAALFSSVSLVGAPVSCNQCHAQPSGSAPLLISANNINESQSLKPPQLQNLYEKTGFSKSSTSNNRGFGFGHDGSFDSIFEFLQQPIFSFPAGAAGDTQRRDLEAFLMCYPTDTHPAVGVQLTFNGANNNDPAALSLFNTLLTLADAGVVGLVAKGRYFGAPRGFTYLTGLDEFQSDRAVQIIDATVLRQSAAPGAEITFTVVPQGTQTRIGIDRDEDGAFDQDELDYCSNPRDPSSLPFKGDLNGDHVVDLSDLSVLLAHFGQTGATAAQGDLNNDTVVDLSDLATLLAYYGSHCP